ncbi:hypothetical protein DEJ33_07150 [Curtobacterium sp. MCPF17_047]|nr:hypothetical protein DEJ33_07150 [Curtobacterium sp. MCPF17_047]
MRSSSSSGSSRRGGESRPTRSSCSRTTTSTPRGRLRTCPVCARSWTGVASSTPPRGRAPSRCSARHRGPDVPAERSGFVQRAWQSGLPRILSGSVIGQGAVLAVSPLLTRLYQPAAFGLLAVVTGVSAVVGAVATLGLERAVPLPRSGTAARVLVTSACIAVAVSGVVTTLLTFGYRRELGTALSAPALVGLWWMIPVAVVAIALQRIVAAVLTRRRDHGALGARNALQGVVQVVASVALAPAGVIGLVIAPSAGRIAASIGGLGWMRRPTFRLVSCRVGRLVLGRFRRFIWAAPLSALLNVSGQQLPTLMIASSEGVVVAGFVGLAVRVLAAPVGVLTDAVGQ